ncbi:hypothetical protein C5167_018436 [Papaver somniferum]|uniref:Uncharacterized protein n=1 Tax=Papaver somniferum TaxID=3469 RepID=A0A4Y7IRC5_PAPSO|nr:hypothetical protein C5167_018436 [Papaver somniferum]
MDHPKGSFIRNEGNDGSILSFFSAMGWKLEKTADYFGFHKAPMMGLQNPKLREYDPMSALLVLVANGKRVRIFCAKALRRVEKGNSTRLCCYKSNETGVTNLLAWHRWLTNALAQKIRTHGKHMY